MKKVINQHKMLAMGMKIPDSKKAKGVSKPVKKTVKKSKMKKGY